MKLRRVLQDGALAELDGDQLRRLRVAAGLSQRELGAVCGTTGAAVALWEAGAHVPRLLQIARLLDLFGSALSETGAITTQQVKP